MLKSVLAPVLDATADDANLESIEIWRVNYELRYRFKVNEEVHERTFYRSSANGDNVLAAGLAGVHDVLENQVASATAHLVGPGSCLYDVCACGRVGCTGAGSAIRAVVLDLFNQVFAAKEAAAAAETAETPAADQPIEASINMDAPDGTAGVDGPKGEPGEQGQDGLKIELLDVFLDIRSIRRLGTLDHVQEEAVEFLADLVLGEECSEECSDECKKECQAAETPATEQATS
jgi:hypothetical protein